MRQCKFLILLMFSLPLAAQETTTVPTPKTPGVEPEKKDTNEDRAKALQNLLPSLAKLKEELAKIEDEHGLGVKEAEKDKDEKLKYHWEMSSGDGWTLGIDLGLITDWDSNHAITGIDGGLHLKLGAQFAFISNFQKGEHEWRSKFTLMESFTKTPTIDGWVKSRDALEYETSYLWSLSESWGAMAQLDIDTSIFPGVDLEEKPVNYFIVDSLGVPLRTVANTDRITLTKYFLPLHFKQILGAWIRPIKATYLTCELKAGGYATETIANGQLKFKSRDGNNLTLKELSSYTQIGPYIGADFLGKINPISLTYRASFDFGYGTFNSDTVSLIPTFTDDLHFEAELSVTFNPFKSVAITLDTRAHYAPNVSPDIQIENKVFLNLPLEI